MDVVKSVEYNPRHIEASYKRNSISNIRDTNMSYHPDDMGDMTVIVIILVIVELNSSV